MMMLISLAQLWDLCFNINMTVMHVFLLFDYGTDLRSCHSFIFRIHFLFHLHSINCYIISLSFICKILKVNVFIFWCCESVWSLKTSDDSSRNSRVHCKTYEQGFYSSPPSQTRQFSSKLIWGFVFLIPYSVCVVFGETNNHPWFVTTLTIFLFFFFSC